MSYKYLYTLNEAINFATSQDNILRISYKKHTTKREFTNRAQYSERPNFNRYAQGNSRPRKPNQNSKINFCS